MRLPALTSLILVLCAVVDARVTFQYSEVLQVHDIANNVAAPFNCPDGCKVYVDRIDEALYITKDGQFIANFNDIVGNNSYNPDGLELSGSKNYKLQSRSAINADFVFYVVSKYAPNYGVPVYAPQGQVGTSAVGISFQSSGRYFTLLSRYNAIEYFGFSGTFPSSYPKIYSTGFDSVSDVRCSPVYQARSQYNAEQSRPMIFSPIITVDFGYTGNVTAIQKDGKNPLKSAISSTVYMSPGYVGCSYTVGLSYFSNVQNIQDNFQLNANSLDLTTVYSSVSTMEPVKLRVNKDTLDFSGTNSWLRRYGAGSFDVALSWSRVSLGSSWALQFDFGAGTNPGWQATSPRPPSTTSSGGTASTFIALFAVALFALLL